MSGEGQIVVDDRRRGETAPAVARRSVCGGLDGLGLLDPAILFETGRDREILIFHGT